jgi:hypothetical protein
MYSKITLQLYEMTADPIEISISTTQGAFEIRYFCRISGGEDEDLGQFESSIESVDFVSPLVQASQQLAVAPFSRM